MKPGHVGNLYNGQYYFLPPLHKSLLFSDANPRRGIRVETGSRKVDKELLLLLIRPIVALVHVVDREISVGEHILAGAST